MALNAGVRMRLEKPGSQCWRANTGKKGCVELGTGKPRVRSVLTIDTRHPGFDPPEPTPSSLRIGFEDAMDPVMIRGDRQELIVRDDPDPRLEPPAGNSETLSRITWTPLTGSMVRTAPLRLRLKRPRHIRRHPAPGSTHTRAQTGSSIFARRAVGRRRRAVCRARPRWRA